LLFSLTLVFLYLFTVVGLCGLIEGEPIIGGRFSCVKCAFNFWLRMMGVLGMWTWFSHAYETDVDYTEYLGPTSTPKTASRTDIAPTLVCNHLGAQEIWGFMTTPNPPRYAAKADIKHWPIAGKLT